MMLQTWRFITLLLAALGLTMGAAHVLELPQKMGYDAQMYAAVNTTLYRQFAIVGAVWTVGSIVAAGMLSFIVRARPSFHLTLAGTVCLALSFGLWLVLVAPVNAEVARVLQSAPDTVPSVWMRLRERWEYGHVAAFLAWLTGFSLLLLSVVRETSTERPVERGAVQDSVPRPHPRGRMLHRSGRTGA
jgi:hypothetical protein